MFGAKLSRNSSQGIMKVPNAIHGMIVYSETERPTERPTESPSRAVD